MNPGVFLVLLSGTKTTSSVQTLRMSTSCMTVNQNEAVDYGFVVLK